jgi:hypothetical protein
MIRGLRSGSLIGVLLLGLACGTEPPTGPATLPTLTPPPPPPPPSRPPGEPIATYVFTDGLDYAVTPVTTASRYVLWDGGVFGLRYDGSAYTFLGKYREDNGTITFQFDGQGAGPPAIATGTVTGDLLEVRSNAMMQQSDFKNAVYRRSQ